jgi:hypothetical protein
MRRAGRFDLKKNAARESDDRASPEHKAWRTFHEKCGRDRDRRFGREVWQNKFLAISCDSSCLAPDWKSLRATKSNFGGIQRRILVTCDKMLGMTTCQICGEQATLTADCDFGLAR